MITEVGSEVFKVRLNEGVIELTVGRYKPVLFGENKMYELQHVLRVFQENRELPFTMGD